MLETKNLFLISCDKETLEFAIEGNQQLAKHLNLTVPENWTEFGTPALKYSLEKITSGENEQGWWTYFPIHKADKKLIGSCGYKGAPDTNGIVEIGYEIAGDYRNQGLATEVVSVLIKNAFANENVKAVQAHTLAEINASTKVLAKCGFVKIQEIDDPEDGKIWQWKMKK
jgi:[ribosomal protein S5]-alanine N-acetyltransferase